MPLTLSEAKDSDASRIAEIHMAAFGSNLMLQAQFPTPSIREQLRDCIAQKAQGDIRDPKVAVLVVREAGKDLIISFAKWSLPIHETESYKEVEWKWPEGTNHTVLKQWTEIVQSAERKVLGAAPHYHLSFIATDPAYERLGAASLCIQWALQHCKVESVPAYLEGTTNSHSLYTKHGFKTAEEISMVLESTGEGESVVYRETCFLYTPPPAPYRGFF